MFAQVAEIAKTADQFNNYGLVGLLMFVIVLLGAYLLYHVLSQAKQDRVDWKETNGKMTTVIDKVGDNLDALTAKNAEVLRIFQEKAIQRRSGRDPG